MSSVIVYTYAYNAEATLPRAIESVLSQTFRDFTYYIVDNGSTDATGAIIRSFADRDKRIVPLANLENNVWWADGKRVTNNWFFFLLEQIDTDSYFCLLDPDDEYISDFLEKTIVFAHKHDLDITVAGSNYLDGASGRLLEKKTIKSELLLEGCAFADDFLDYRSYINAFWNKLYKISLLKDLHHDRLKDMEHDRLPKITFAHDTALVLMCMMYAKRVGFLAEPLHNYYHYPASLSRVFNSDRLNDCHVFFQFYVHFLERFGPVSPLNMDYLYAIWLGWMDDFIFRPLRDMDLPLDKKLSALKDIFDSDVTKAMLGRDADPRFRNLAARESFLQDVRRWMYAQEASGTPLDRVLVLDVLASMDVKRKELV